MFSALQNVYVYSNFFSVVPLGYHFYSHPAKAMKLRGFDFIFLWFMKKRMESSSWGKLLEMELKLRGILQLDQNSLNLELKLMPQP